ncbi:glutathione transferase [Herbaspirillum robiniae]|uniref:Glutathione S-transferase n=1 Tax=Herbaspirillum robiniae TaxID=2014887 RepID=A0A246WLL9_9BURK|nr:glutathione transferase [Herbaspirillum robiniae]OWY27224.1 glutathione S-transferase [Herbaspirillum robiniae]
MNTPQLQLYVDAQFISPYAMSAFVTLTEKGLPFELLTIDLATRQNQGAGYASVSLTRRVPALTDGDFHLAESTAISEYLEERFPAPTHQAVYPADARRRAKAREVQAWLRSDLLALRKERPTEVVFFGEGYAPLSDAARAAADKLTAAAQILLEGKDTLFGQWCIADTDLALMLNRMAMHGDDLPEPLRVYARAQWQRPSVQQWVRQAQAMKAATP